MFETLPKPYSEIKDWTWEDFKPYAEALLARPLDDELAHEWLSDSTKLAKMFSESYSRLAVSNSQDTTDSAIEAKYKAFLDAIMPEIMKFGDAANRKIMQAEIEPPHFEIPLRNIRAEIELFREENLPLLTEEQKIGMEYDKILGAQSIEWDGKEEPATPGTLTWISPLLESNDRATREGVWTRMAARFLQDREAINQLWTQLLPLRGQLARNAGLKDYRDYVWKSYKRFDYTPQDCETFHAAIEKAVVPAAKRVYERARQQMGVETLRPWDISADALARPPLKPYQTIEELNHKTSAIFHQVDPVLGGYYDDMLAKGLLDLEVRKGKAPGGYCTQFGVEQVPFIFMNAVGVHEDIRTLIHEGGHAFHVYETNALPYYEQQQYPIEFAEVASMAMELLTTPYWSEAHGGYYSEADAARARIEHIEKILTFWPYMAVMDGFQHWAYTHPDAAMNPAECDAKWGELWDRFIQGIDYTDFEETKKTGWHRKLHVFKYPFYYVEYGLAQLGAVQVFGNALEDQAKAVADYRKGLSLGYTVGLPQLYEAAGVKFAFDYSTMQRAVDLLEKTIADLE
jgi:oligoendopeptidase F